MTELAVLDDRQLEAVSVGELRAAYRALRDARAAEAEEHAAAIRAALAQRRSDGKKNGGSIPYGYKVDVDGETLVELKREQRVIAEARRLRADGLSLRAIAQRLYEQRMRSRSGDRFDSTQIRRMLNAVRSTDG